MPAADDAMNLLGRLDQLRHGAFAGALGVALPEMLKEAIEGMDGFDFLGGPLRQFVAGIGGLGEVFGTDVSRTVQELTSSVKTLWDMGGGNGMLAEVTTAIGALGKFNPLAQLNSLIPTKPEQ